MDGLHTRLGFQPKVYIYFKMSLPEKFAPFSMIKQKCITISETNKWMKRICLNFTHWNIENRKQTTVICIETREFIDIRPEIRNLSKNYPVKLIDPFFGVYYFLQKYMITCIRINTTRLLLFVSNIHCAFKRSFALPPVPPIYYISQGLDRLESFDLHGSKEHIEMNLLSPFLAYANVMGRN